MSCSYRKSSLTALMLLFSACAKPEKVTGTFDSAVPSDTAPTTRTADASTTSQPDPSDGTGGSGGSASGGTSGAGSGAGGGSTSQGGSGAGQDALLDSPGDTKAPDSGSGGQDGGSPDIVQAPTGVPQDAIILFDEAHEPWSKVTGTWARFAADVTVEGHTVKVHSTGALTAILLQGTDILAVSTSWGAFTPAELEVIRSYVNSGGKLLLTGLAWSWVDPQSHEPWTTTR